MDRELDSWVEEVMAKQKFTHFIPRDLPKKRPGVHKKTQNKTFSHFN